MRLNEEINDERKHFKAIADGARLFTQSHRAYDSAIRSLTASTAMGVARKALAEREFLEKSSIKSIASSLNKLAGVHTISPSVRAMTKANASIKSIFESTRSMDSAMRTTLERDRHWQKMTKNLSLSGQLTTLTIGYHTSSMLSASLTAQSKIMQVNSFPLGVAIHASKSLQQSLHFGLDKLASNYNKLFNFIDDRASTLAEFAPDVTRYPPIEVLREAELLKEITVPEDDREVLDKDEVAIVPDERSLEDWLHELDPGLTNILNGARDALISSNVDRARHVTTSIRELFTHVLHRLAPDDGIKAWTTDDGYYHQGRPTRKARLLYINRGINLNPLSDFVDADVNAALTLIKALHSGTHGISPSLNDRQLRAMVDRMESLLLFLFRLNTRNK